MHLPFEHSLFSAIDFSTNREAWVPVVMITVILGVLWVIDSSGRNPFSAFPYPYETFVILIPTITLLIPTAAFLYATGGSFRSIRLSSHQLWSAALRSNRIFGPHNCSFQSVPLRFGESLSSFPFRVRVPSGLSGDFLQRFSPDQTGKVVWITQRIAWHRYNLQLVPCARGSVRIQIEWGRFDGEL